MNGRRRRLLLETLDPMLAPGEQVEVTTLVNLSSVSVARTAAFAAVSAALSGGMAVIPVPTPMYLAVTDLNLYIFQADPMFSRPRAHLMTIPRAGLVRTPVKERILNSSFVVSHPEGDQGLRLIFGGLGRKERNLVAAALPVAG
ncbi:MULTISPECIES: hypothetical protein [unclassified Nocardiopsis]|uniref:hypothetical protein n=1 Tax=Nocardiopsis TaxID=2013 RepID=UPI00387B5F65